MKQQSILHENQLKDKDIVRILAYQFTGFLSFHEEPFKK